MTTLLLMHAWGGVCVFVRVCQTDSDSSVWKKFASVKHGMEHCS